MRRKKDIMISIPMTNENGSENTNPKIYVNKYQTQRVNIMMHTHFLFANLPVLKKYNFKILRSFLKLNKYSKLLISN